jgi:hypothetical protein
MAAMRVLAARPSRAWTPGTDQVRARLQLAPLQARRDLRDAVKTWDADPRKAAIAELHNNSEVRARLAAAADKAPVERWAPLALELDRACSSRATGRPPQQCCSRPTTTVTTSAPPPVRSSPRHPGRQPRPRPPLPDRLPPRDSDRQRRGHLGADQVAGSSPRPAGRQPPGAAAARRPTALIARTAHITRLGPS